ncbi:hypothetical protein [Archaeoglobus sp. JdFR-39]|jgi:hypothetical protein|nr:hypothetical protein [Archaeoglobus sp. JdFR-39]
MPSKRKKKMRPSGVLRLEYRRALEESMKEYDDLLRELAKL